MFVTNIRDMEFDMGFLINCWGAKY